MDNLSFNSAGNLFYVLLVVVLPLYFGNAQEIINANPTTGLEVHINKPVYYYVEDKLYYTPHGEINLNNPIWQGEISERYYNGEVSVSPDSRYVVIHHKTGLNVIDSLGNTICRIKNVGKSVLDRRPDTFWCKDFQWSVDSKALYLVKDVAYTFQEGSPNRCALVKLDVTNGSLTTVYNFTEQSWRFYPGTHNTIYYTAYDKTVENWLFKKVDLATGAITPVYSDDEHRLQTTDTIYANLEFERRLYNNRLLIGNRSYEECSIYATGKDGTEQLLFEVQCGTSALDKKKRFHIREINSEVYISDKYYLVRMYAEGYKTMVVDLKTLEYRFYKEWIKPYVASTIETENFMYISGDLLVRK
ncbi:hypothetical protein AM493_13480 [Flavobacterium akiainvivens]|uniref:Uncharacterized protein n=1 Tax=Flavobacterium akiainvivens TaxID=1202724 RepID=A0A0M9VIQ8_9FLAO|nr:hypothetical protein [Flavobacterium akiainvivens]KOS06929.1 hypothetical protein AM493_13480 [Flavobacterium akiainvivens]SFQ69913.1 hypothetical protein SAMN05444144_11588 [Flavobacterium akiainvivens]